MLSPKLILLAIFIPIILGMVLWPRVRKGAMGKNPAGYVFTVMAGAFAAATAVAWLSLPIVFHGKRLKELETDVVDASTLARLILEQNEALLKTTEVVHWLTFATFIILMNASFVVPSLLTRMQATTNPTAAPT